MHKRRWGTKYISVSKYGYHNFVKIFQSMESKNTIKYRFTGRGIEQGSGMIETQGIKSRIWIYFGLSWYRNNWHVVHSSHLSFQWTARHLNLLHNADQFWLPKIVFSSRMLTTIDERKGYPDQLLNFELWDHNIGKSLAILKYKAKREIFYCFKILFIVFYFWQDLKIVTLDPRKLMDERGI